MTTTENVHLTLDDVFSLSLDALVGCGANPDNAKPVAESIRDAEADGIRNVGLNYLPHYCEHLLCGKVNGQVKAAFKQTAPGVVICDARSGFAHSAFVLTFDKFVSVALNNGIGSLCLQNSYAAGVIGWYVEKIAEQGLVGLAFANSPVAIAPWGGTRAFFGTNPMAFAFPRPDDFPILIDQSSSTTAKVNVVQAANKGEPIPDTWALDKYGNPTTDPKAGLEGSMSPAGGYKGVAMAMIVDLLAGALGGPSMSYNASLFAGNSGGPPNVGQFFIAIDPDAYNSDFAQRAEEMISAMLEQENVRLPGNRRFLNRALFAEQGVTLEYDLYQKLKGYSQAQSVSN